MILNRVIRGCFLLIASIFLSEIENKVSRREWGEERGLGSGGDLEKEEKA